MHKLEVGQVLWFVSRNRGVNEFVTVEKVGRKWAEVRRHRRINMKDLTMDAPGYGTVGHCYLRKEDHDAEVALSSAWWALSRRVQDCRSTPPDMTVERIRQVEDILFPKMPDAPAKEPPNA